MKKPRMMKKGGAAGGVMTLAQLRKAASAKGMKLVKK
jgi:NAD(P)H-dependent FMN reductase